MTFDVDECKVLDYLALPVLQDLEVIGGQVRYGFSFAVGDYGIHLNQIDINANDAVVRSLPRRGLRRQYRNQAHQQAQGGDAHSHDGSMPQVRGFCENLVGASNETILAPMA